ncbi:glycosyltransferase family 2 protein [Paenibacillus silvisoli]|uniref:glycosyltransferase family 2 protein n=1 Tax=Paenibacillus silvisoli TaxID=3110539 RepID=UPI002805D478|nr:glycosyltransferase [Paenibacillus silvisoli]
MDITQLWSGILFWYSRFILLFMLLVSGFYLIMFLFSFLSIRKAYKLNELRAHEEIRDIMFTKPISVIVPAYNEEAGIIESVRSLLSLRYPQLEVIVVNDGSIDRTHEVMMTHFQMVPIDRAVRQLIPTQEVRAVYQSTQLPHLYMLSKVNGGKADSLNAGINFAKYSYFCSIDGDSILERDAFVKIMKPIISSGENVIAAGGSVRIANGCDIQMGIVKRIRLSDKPLVVFQVIEYLRAFLIGRIGLSRYNLMLIISGAFGVFDKEWVVAAGGYSTRTTGEDMELVVKLHRLVKERGADKRIIFVPDAVCWTEAPETATFLRRQRSRWHRGLLDSLWTHRKMLLNPRYGYIGLIAFPYYLVIELFGPIIELGGYLFIVLSLIFGGMSVEFSVLLFLAFLLYGSIISLLSLLLEEWSLRRYADKKDIVKLYFYSLTEVIWFRPLTVVWRVEGVFQFLFGYKRWGEMKRKGIA